MTQLVALAEKTTTSRNILHALRIHNVLVVVCNIAIPFKTDENANAIKMFGKLSTCVQYFKSSILVRYDNYDYNVLDLTSKGSREKAIDLFFEKISNALADRGSSMK